jgi:hypothetical protein
MHFTQVPLEFASNNDQKRINMFVREVKWSEDLEFLERLIAESRGPRKPMKRSDFSEKSYFLYRVVCIEIRNS